MVDEEIDDIFKDFKFPEDEEPSHREVKKKVQKEFNQQKFEEHEDKFYIQGVKEPRVSAKWPKGAFKHTEDYPDSRQKTKYPAPGLGVLERGVFIGIIVLLIAFIVFDLSFFDHVSKVSETTEQGAVGMVINEVNESENKTVEEEVIEEENKTVEEETTEEKSLSGTVGIKIDKINKIKVSNDTGYITTVFFTIKNEKSETLKPVVRVYAYDSKLEDSWGNRSRGIFNYTAGIPSGSEQSGSIGLSPKTFKALDIIKTVILKLSDENDNIIASDTEKVYIE